MIDIENRVFTPIAKAVRAEFSGASVTGEYVRAPSKFPHVSITESDNYMTLQHLDSADAEKYATIMYEINVYSNKASGKKSESKAIMQIVDEMMLALNFTRIARTPVPNLEDSTIYRLTARYMAETDGTNIYRTRI